MVEKVVVEETVERSLGRGCWEDRGAQDKDAGRTEEPGTRMLGRRLTGVFAGLALGHTSKGCSSGPPLDRSAMKDEANVHLATNV